MLTAQRPTVNQLSLLGFFDKEDRIVTSLIDGLRKELLNFKYLRFHLNYRLEEIEDPEQTVKTFDLLLDLLAVLIQDLSRGKYKKEDLLATKSILSTYEPLSVEILGKALPKAESRCKTILFAHRAILDTDNISRSKLEQIIRILDCYLYVEGKS